MVRRAAIFGCNYAGSSHALHGCINDAHAIYEMLVYAYQFDPQASALAVGAITTVQMLSISSCSTTMAFRMPSSGYVTLLSMDLLSGCLMACTRVPQLPHRILPECKPQVQTVTTSLQPIIVACSLMLCGCMDAEHLDAD